MKKTITVMLLGLIVLFAVSCKPSTEDAINYNDKIIDQQVMIIEKINALYKALDDYTNHERMDRAYNDAVKQVELGTEEVTKLKDFGGSSEFKDGALKLFGIYKSVLSNEFKKMIEISKLPDDLYTTEKEAEWKKMDDDAFNKMDVGLNELKSIQKSFADEYKFDIEKTY